MVRAFVFVVLACSILVPANAGRVAGVHSDSDASEKEKPLHEASPDKKTDIVRPHGEAGPAVDTSSSILEQEGSKISRPKPGGGRIYCVSAQATAWLAPCHANSARKSQQSIATRVKDLKVGDCVLDGDGVTQIFYRNTFRKEEMHAERILEVELDQLDHAAVNLTANHLVPTADGDLVPAMYLLPGQAAGGGIVKKLTVHRDLHEVVMLYTVSGKILLGEHAQNRETEGTQPVLGGVVVSSYVHWFEEWASMDTRLIFHAFGEQVVSSSWYQAYFWMKLDMLQPIMYFLWPYHAGNYVSKPAADVAGTRHAQYETTLV
eukprot:TRINITY_DN56844_c0_g1_i1.p1 TRINITY_DN56844_c0_g1~~TRINITY_DN56844_c0_g1_i1.p1  ORF type:complete len:319 (+),score=61.60 TRINITY_DN56844_c0_g1_i1:76-1032(+)